MSSLQPPHDIFQNLSEAEYKLISIEQLKTQTRKNYNLVIQQTMRKQFDPLNSCPPQKQNAKAIFSNKFHSGTSSYSSNKSEGIAGAFLISDRKQIQNGLNGDVDHPISRTLNLSPSQKRDQKDDFEHPSPRTLNLYPSQKKDHYDYYEQPISRTLNLYPSQKIEHQNDSPETIKSSEKYWSRFMSLNQTPNHDVLSSRQPSPTNENLNNGSSYFQKKPKLEEALTPNLQQYFSTPPSSQALDVTNIATLRQSRFATGSSNSKRQKQDKEVEDQQISCKVQRDGKKCKLCELSRFHMKRMKEKKLPLLLQDSIKKQQPVEKWEEEQWLTSVEPRLSRINNTPEKSNKQEYLSSQDKYEFRNGSLEASEKYLEPGSLRRQFLLEVQCRRKAIDKQLSNLHVYSDKTPEKASKIISFPASPVSQSNTFKPPRKKIFESAKIAKQPQSPEHFTKHSGIFTSRFTKSKEKSGEKTYSALYASRMEKKLPSSLYPQKTITRQVKFDHLRANLTNHRIKVYRSKSKECESPRKSMIPGLKLYQMPIEMRRWYEANRKQIVMQCERICLNQLVLRYMSQQQISSRLYKFVVGMVDPKKWLMLMIDQVYAKLKDRYMTLPSQ